MDEKSFTMNDKYYTHCFLCEKEWGAGELHVLDRIYYYGKYVATVFLCLDCAHKHGIGENKEKE